MLTKSIVKLNQNGEACCRRNFDVLEQFGRLFVNFRYLLRLEKVYKKMEKYVGVNKNLGLTEPEW